MATAATNTQVQNFVDQRLRPRAEQIRALLLDMQDDVASIDSVYAAVTESNPTWTDQRTDGPPNLLVASDVAALNTLLHDLITAISGDAQYPIAQKACVRPVNL